MVSTSRNKSRKIISCLGEIVFSYSEFFASGNHNRNVEANFERKTSLLLVETTSVASKKQFFSICQTFLAMNIPEFQIFLAGNIYIYVYNVYIYIYSYIER